MQWDKLAERQILKAQAEGQLDELKGAGKPLKPDAGGAEAAGFRIMAEAGVLPREIELRKTVDALTAKLKTTPDGDARTALLRDLATVQLRLDIEQGARRKYMHLE